MRARTTTITIAAGALALAGAALAAFTTGGDGDDPYTSSFGLERTATTMIGRLTADGGNAFISLDPGTFQRYEGEIDGEFVEIEITALPATRVITFILAGQRIRATARVVEEREWIAGQLAEVTYNYYARCGATNNIYVLGEDVNIYEDGEVISHEGTWRAGEGDALPGLFMPSVFLLGSRYYQELAGDVARDRAEHVNMGFEFKTPLGTFHDCMAVLETDPLDPNDETIKIYSPQVGLVADGPLVLVEHRR